MTRDERRAGEPAFLAGREDACALAVVRGAEPPRAIETPPEPTAPGTRTFRLDDPYCRALFKKERTALAPIPLMRFNPVLREEGE